MGERHLERGLKRHYRFWLYACLVLTLFAQQKAFGEPSDADRSHFQKAVRAIHEGKLEDSFTLFATLLGGGSFAAQVGERDPAHFLKLLEGVDGPEVALIRADLLLASGDKAEALVYYRAALQSPPPNGYYVISKDWEGMREGEPFLLDGGSQRDNWLLRRLLGLEAWAEADREFSRVWAIHQKRNRGRPFDRVALRFAVDYAEYLERRGQAESARRVLRLPLPRLDLDRALALAELPSLVLRSRRLRRLPGISQTEFLAQAHRLLGKSLAEGVPKAGNGLRVHAALCRLEGDSAAALALEKQYLKTLKLDPASENFRYGLLYERHGQVKLARTHFEKVIKFSGRADSDINVPDFPLAESWNSDPYHLQEFYRERAATPGLWLTRQAHHRLAYLSDPPTPRQKLAKDKADFLKSRNRHIVGLERALDKLEARSTKLSGEEKFLSWVHRAAENADHPALVRAALWKRLGDKREYRRFALLAAHQRVAETSAALEKWPSDHSRGSYVQAQVNVMRLEGKGWSEEAKRLPYELAPTVRAASELVDFYGKERQTEKLHRLGRELLDPAGPLAKSWEKYSGTEAYFDSELDNLQMLLLLHINPEEFPELGEHLVAFPDSPASKALARLNGTAVPPPKLLNLPEGSVMVSDDNYSCLAATNEHLFLGTNWGVDIRSHGGERLAKLPLDGRTNDMVVNGDTLWLGTENGLYRVKLGDWSVERTNANHAWSAARIERLALENSQLWLFTTGGPARLNLGTGELLCFDSAEFGDRQVRVFQADGELWIGNRYIGANGEPAAPLLYEGRPVYPFALIDGQLWGSFGSGQRLPAIIDRSRNTVTPVTISGSIKGSAQWKHFGFLNEQPVLKSSNSGFWEWDGSTLQKLQASSSSYRGEHDPAKYLGSLARDAEFRALSPFGDALRVEPVPLASGGVALLHYNKLHLLAPDSQTWLRSVSASSNQNLGPFHSLTFGDRKAWAVGKGCLVEIDEAGGFTVARVANSRTVLSGPGAKLGDGLYFGNNYELIRYDLEKKILTRHALVGLPGPIIEVRECRPFLKLTLQPPDSERLAIVECDPRQGDWTFLKRSDSRTSVERKREKSTRVLGLHMSRTEDHLGKRYHLGQGLVVVPSDWKLSYSPLAVKPRFSPKVTERRQARSKKSLSVASADELRRYLKAPEASTRAQAVLSAGRRLGAEKLLPELGLAVDDPSPEVRNNALAFLMNCYEEDSTRIIRRLAKDPVLSIRGKVHYSLLSRGQEADPQVILESYKSDRGLLRGFTMMPLVTYEDIESTLPLLLAICPTDDALHKVLGARVAENPALLGPLLTAHNEKQREFSLRAIEASGAGLIKNIRPFLTSPQVATKLTACEAISLLGSGEAEPIVRELLSAGDFGVRKRALGILGRHGSPESFPTLMQHFHAARVRPRPRIQSRAVEFEPPSGYLDGLSGEPTHYDFMERVQEPEAADFLRTIGEIGGEQAHPYLREGIRKLRERRPLTDSVLALAQATGPQVRPNIELLRELTVDRECAVAAGVALFILSPEEGEANLRSLLKSRDSNLVARTRSQLTDSSTEKIKFELWRRFKDAELPRTLRRDKG